jgi:hypothetical protein
MAFHISAIPSLPKTSRAEARVGFWRLGLTEI